MLILTGANIVAELVGKKRSKRENKKIPWWKRDIQIIIAELRRHVAQLQEWNRRKLSKNGVKADPGRKYYVKNIGVNVVVEKMKRSIKAKTTKLQKYDERNNLYKTGHFKILFIEI